jgi:hypothetical protein
MKKILAGFLALGTLNAFAVTLNNAVINTNSDQIREALILKLNEKELTCRTTLNDEDIYSGAVPYTKEDIIRVIEAEAYTVEINKENSQPAITLRYSDYETTIHINFTTTTDFKDLIAIDAAIGKSTYEVVNNGTLINPEITEKETFKAEYKEECSLGSLNNNI